MSNTERVVVYGDASHRTMLHCGCCEKVTVHEITGCQSCGIPLGWDTQRADYYSSYDDGLNEDENSYESAYPWPTADELFMDCPTCGRNEAACHNLSTVEQRQARVCHQTVITK